MNKRIGNAAILLSLLIFYSGNAVAQMTDERPKQIGLNIGYGLTAMDDVNNGIELMKSSGLDQDKISGGTSIRAQMLHPSNPNYSLVFGIGYIRAISKGTIKIPYTTEYGPDVVSAIDMEHQIGGSLILIQAGATYSKPVSFLRMRYLHIIGAFNLYHGTAYESGKVEEDNEIAWTQYMDYTNKASSFGFGFEASIMPVWPLSIKWQFCGGFGYRYAPISGFDADFLDDDFTLDFSGIFFNCGILYSLE